MSLIWSVAPRVALVNHVDLSQLYDWFSFEFLKNYQSLVWIKLRLAASTTRSSFLEQIIICKVNRT